MKSLMTMAAVIFTTMPYLAHAVPQTCTVTETIPARVTFFSFNMRPVVKGSTATIDPSAPEIDEIIFSNGAGLHLKDINAKLVRNKDAPDESPFYEGTHKSNTSDYIGVLYGYSGPEQTSLSLEVLRKEFFAGMTLHKVIMSCVPKN